MFIPSVPIATLSMLILLFKMFDNPSTDIHVYMMNSFAVLYADVSVLVLNRFPKSIDKLS
jgi:hypothetical protein